MIDFNKFDYTSNTLCEGLKEVAKQLNIVGDVDLKEGANKILKEGVKSLNNVDQNGIYDMEKKAVKLKDKMFEINKDSINDFKKWQ